MVRYAELGVDELICYVQFGYLSHESIMRTIELLGTKVIPELEKVGIRTEVKPAPGQVTAEDLEMIKRTID